MARRGDGIVLKKKSWYLEARINGVRYQKRLGKGISRSVALELASVLRGQILKGEAGVGKKRKDIGFDDAGEKFLAWATTEKRANTLRGYRKCLARLAQTFGSQKLGQITTWQLESYRQKRSAGVTLTETERPADTSDANWARLCKLAQKGAPIRVNRELGLVKNLFNKMISWGLYEGENPVCKVKFKKEPRTRLRWLKPEEADRLLAACAEPLKTLVLVGLHCGLRIQAEALTLRWEDVDLKRGMLVVQAGYAKNGKTRSVPLNSIVRAALEQLQRTAIGDLVFSKVDGLPFRSIKTVFRTACKRAGLVGVTPHTLRHTFASRLVASGVDLRSVQTLGGWASLSMIERYSHVSAPHLAAMVERIAGEEFTCEIPCRENATLAVVS
jgi:integrase